MTDWPKIIREVMKEKRISIRGLAAQSGLHRSTIRLFLRTGRIGMDTFERLMPVLGLELRLLDPHYCTTGD